MAKYKYTMRIQKIVIMSEETFQVLAENEKEAKHQALKEAKKHPEKFEQENEKYKIETFSYTCYPVEE